MWGVGSQALCLTISTWFIFLSHGEDVFLYSAIAIICISRLGLWVIDITVTQLQQQEIPEQYRCLMGGVQEALNACFHIVAFVFGLLFPHPDDFIYISLSGCLSVSLAFIVFFFGMYLPRRNTETPVFRLPSIEHRAPMT
jgi:iron-regulated transporter 1